MCSSGLSSCIYYANSNSLLNCLHRLEQAEPGLGGSQSLGFSSYDNIPIKQQQTLPLIWFSMSEPLDVALEHFSLSGSSLT